MIETNRLNIYPASREQMVNFIEMQSVDELKIAYTEMLKGCLNNPDSWEWYTIWMVELKDGMHVGELCFKGLSKEGTSEIGYGIKEQLRCRGYATEAVSALITWALNQTGVKQITAEVEPSNTASIKVLEKAGFINTAKTGKEGLIFTRKKAN